MVASLIGIAIGAIASWFFSRLYYIKNLKTTRKDNALVKLNLGRLMLKVGVRPGRPTSPEAHSLLMAAIKQSRAFNSFGDIVWNYCWQCGADNVRRMEPTAGDVDNASHVETITRTFNGVDKWTAVPFTSDNSFMWRCSDCGETDLYLKANVKYSLQLPESGFQEMPDVSLFGDEAVGRPPIILKGKARSR